VPYGYEESYRDLNASERHPGKYGCAPDFIGPVQIGYSKKIREPYYITLTVMLLRDKKKPNRWQVRVRWVKPAKDFQPW
jgi:hypothetical protein